MEFLGCIKRGLSHSQWKTCQLHSFLTGEAPGNFVTKSEDLRNRRATISLCKSCKPVFWVVQAVEWGSMLSAETEEGPGVLWISIVTVCGSRELLSGLQTENQELRQREKLLVSQNQAAGSKFSRHLHELRVEWLKIRTQKDIIAAKKLFSRVRMQQPCDVSC